MRKERQFFWDKRRMKFSKLKSNENSCRSIERERNIQRERERNIQREREIFRERERNIQRERMERE